MTAPSAAVPTYEGEENNCCTSKDAPHTVRCEGSVVCRLDMREASAQHECDEQQIDDVDHDVEQG